MMIDNKKLENTLDKRIYEDIDENRILGANVYISQFGKVLLNTSYGYKTVDKEETLTEDNIFRLASMTKPIVAFAVLKLIEQGEIDLFDRADKFIDGFNDFYIGKIADEKIIADKKAENSIKILHLLTHTSGLGSGEIWTKQYPEMTADDKKNLKSAVEFYKKTFLSFESYCGNEYSSTAAFDVLARIVEIVSGKTIEEFLQRELFEPLEMVDTTFSPTQKQWNRIVDMHNLVDGKSVAVDMKGCIFADFPVTYTCGGAGLVSTIKDYAKFAEMLLNYGEYNGKRIISAQCIKSMALSHISEKYIYGSEAWGLGVRTISDGNRLPKGSFGWSGAYGTHFWVDPMNKIVAIYMKNSYYDGGSGALTAAHFEEDIMNSFNN